MVYSIGWKNPFPTATKTEYLDGSRKDIDFEEMDILRERLKYAGCDPLQEGFRIKQNGVSTKMVVGNADRLPLDSINFDLTAISPRLKEIIEHFEPDTHQFFPLDLYRPKEQEPFAQYYTLNICNRIDSVDAEHTTYEFRGDYEKRAGIWDGSRDKSAQLIFNMQQVGDREIWRDPWLSGHLAWCTDDLGEAIAAGEFSGLSLRHFGQVG